MANPEAAQWWVKLSDGTRFGPAATPLLEQWAREGRVPSNATIESDDGGPPVRAADHPRIRLCFAAPPTVAGPLSSPQTADTAMGGLIPYKNVPALVGYYLAIFGGLTAILGPAIVGAIAVGHSRGRPGPGAIIAVLFGALLGLAGPVAAIILGIKGLKRYKQEPRFRGRTHAWVAIIGGTLGSLLALLFSLGLGAAVFSRL